MLHKGDAGRSRGDDRRSDQMLECIDSVAMRPYVALQ